MARRSMTYWFEGTGVVAVVIDGDVATFEALDMAEELIRMKREEIAKKQPPAEPAATE